MTAPARLVPSWGGLTALLLGLGLAVLPARAQETSDAKPADIEAMVEAGQAVVLPLGDALKTPGTVVDAETVSPEDDGTSETADDNTDEDHVAGVDAADAGLPDDQSEDSAADNAAVDEPQVEVVVEETTEKLEPETVPEPDTVMEAVPDEAIADEPVEEVVAAENIEMPEPTSLIEDEIDDGSTGVSVPSADLESEIEAAALVDEATGEGSADFGDVEEPTTETIVVEETIVDEVIVDPDTGEPAAEAIIVEETVIEEVTTVEPGIEETPVEEPTVDEPVIEEAAVDESTDEAPAADDPAIEVSVAEEPESETIEVVPDDQALEEIVDGAIESQPASEEPAVSDVEPEPEEIVVAETAVEAPVIEQPAVDEPEALVGAMVPLRTAELGNAESIGPYRLWLASYKTVRQAKEGWQQIALANQDLLADLTPIIVLKDLGQDEGTFFRLQAGPLQSQGTASARCTALVDRNVYCSVLGP
ncbi:MAG: hypothetical protein AAF563_15070 [Pseudomonadota bacterium]